MLWATSALAAEDWQSTLTPPQAGAFPAMRALKATYKFGWGTVAAAQADFDFTKTKSGQLKLVVTAKTTGMVRPLWRMDTQQTALADAATLRPISLQQTETYKDKTLIAKVTFAPEKIMRWSESKPPGDTPPKWRRFACPNVFDIHSALLFVRSQRLKVNDVYRIVVFPARDAYLTEVEVVGREKLTVAGKEYNAIKCALRLKGINKAMELETHKKFKKAAIWISDDRDRMLLKVQTEVFVGSVWTELQSVKFNEP
jgi:hypothetical protein